MKPVFTGPGALPAPASVRMCETDKHLGGTRDELQPAGPYGQQPQQPGPYGQQPAPTASSRRPAPRPGYGQPAPPARLRLPAAAGRPAAGLPAAAAGSRVRLPAAAPRTAARSAPAHPEEVQGRRDHRRGRRGRGDRGRRLVLPAGGGAGGDISADTKGYKLVAPESVDDYQKARTPQVQRPTPPTQDKKEAEASASRTRTAGMANTRPATREPLAGKHLDVQRALRRDRRPGEGRRRLLRRHRPEEREPRRQVQVQLVGTPKEITPAGFKGAVMKCPDIKMISTKPTRRPRRPRSRAPDLRLGRLHHPDRRQRRRPGLRCSAASSGTLTSRPR